MTRLSSKARLAAAGVLVVALLTAGMLIVLGGNPLAYRRSHEAAFTDTAVVVTAPPPIESFFPVQFVVANHFQTMTNVHVSCTMERIFINQIDFLNTDTLGSEVVPLIAKDAQHTFQCGAPAELHPPFHRDEVHDAHVTLQVEFSVRDRWRRLGVSQGFDLVKNPVPHWQAVAPVLLR